mmetsp:Transcript_6506/g.7776  ORF Transcript_6506/g.7776 Transcript_6506/m.7776 type:complete len:665 (-) Transcript_6506:391-2385(-)
MHEVFANGHLVVVQLLHNLRSLFLLRLFIFISNLVLNRGDVGVADLAVHTGVLVAVLAVVEGAVGVVAVVASDRIVAVQVLVTVAALKIVVGAVVSAVAVVAVETALVVVGGILVAAMVLVLISVVVVLGGLSAEVSDTVVAIFLNIGVRLLRVVHVVMLDTVSSLVLKLVEKFVVLVLDLSHESVTVVVLHVVGVVLTVLVVRLAVVLAKVEVTLEGVVGRIVVGVLVPDGVVVALPVVRAMLNAMHVVVLVNVLGVVLALILLIVVVAHMLGALRLDVVVLAVLLASKVALVSEVRLVVTQVPVALLKVGSWVVLLAVHHDHLVVMLLGVGVLEGSLLSTEVVGGEVSLAATLGGASAGLGKVVHLLVEEGSLWAQVLLSFTLLDGGLLMVVRVVVVRVRLWVHLSVVLVGIALMAIGEVAIVFVTAESVSVSGHMGAHTVELSGIRVGLATVHVGASEVIAVAGVGTRAVGAIRSAQWHARESTEVLTLASQMAVVLLSSNIVVLVRLLCLLALLNVVLRSGLRHHWLHLRKLEAVDTMDVLGTVGLHSEDQAAIFDESLGGTEGGGVGIESGVIALVPAVGVEGVERIAPVEVESLGVRVVGVSLDVVVLDLPRHVLGVEALAPGLKSRGPEVHHNALGLISKLDGGIALFDAAHLFVVD